METRTLRQTHPWRPQGHLQAEQIGEDLSFYLQKCIRKNNDSTNETQQELADWKSLPLETLVVQEAVRRLGVTHLNQEPTTATPTTTITPTTAVEVE
jgi:hypothetical protein